MAACGTSPTCEELLARRAYQDAIATCEPRYAKSHDADDGIRVAQALTYGGRAAEGTALAETLVDQPAKHAADAAYLVGSAALGRKDYRKAVTYLTRARAGHAKMPAKLARDLYQLAGVHRACGEYQRGLAAATEGLALAPDRQMQGSLEIVRADFLRRLGDPSAARAALERAEPLLVTETDRSWWAFKRGLLDVEMHNYETGAVRLAQLATKPGLPIELRAATDLSRAWAAYLSKDTAGAERILAGAAKYGAYALDVAHARAYIARQAGHPAAAAALLAPFANASLDDEWRWDIPIELGRIALALGDRAGAERELRIAIAAIERQRRSDGRFLPSRLQRRPYDELFTLLAEDARWADAVALLVELDRVQLPEVGGVEPTSFDSERLPAPCDDDVPRLPEPRPASRVVEDLRTSARAHDIVIFASANDQLWRIDLARDGAITGAAVGKRARIEALVQRVLAEDAAAQRELGDVLLPTAGTTPLYIATFGELSQIAWPALRPGGKLLVAQRPLVRLAPLDVAPPAKEGGPPLVLADPTSDLPAAKSEGAWVAAKLAVPLVAGDAATRAVLVSSTPRILHVAGHAVQIDRRAALALADANLGASELDDRDWRGTSLVVLATCGSAASIEVDGRGSLAQAFLRGGARAVLATRWPVEDVAAQQFVRAFYDAGGARDPIAALAAAQARLARELPERQWAAFVLLGPVP